MNIGVHASFQISVFIFFGCISISGIAGSYSSSLFGFLRNLHTVFHNGLFQLTNEIEVSRRKGNIKISSEINEIEILSATEKISETKSYLFKKVNKTDKRLVRVIKKKEVKVNKIKNER